MSIERRLLELADETLRETRWKAEIRKIAEEARMIEARIKRLEEAGNEMSKWLDRNTPVTVRNDWIKAKEAKP